MKPAVALAAFGLAIALAFGGGALVGSAVGPIGTGGADHEADHATSRTVEVDGYEVRLDGVLDPAAGSEPTITVERDGDVRTGRVVFDDPAPGADAGGSWMPSHDHEGH